MIALTHAIEALRVANYVDRTEHYRWTVFSIDGNPVEASNGIATAHAGARRVGSAARRDDRVRRYAHPRDGRRVHAAGAERARGAPDRDGRAADRGLLDLYRCAAHWTDLYALRAEFPDVEITDELFAIDRDRITCTGGIAPMDMMLTLMSSDFGPHLVDDMSKHLVVSRLCSGNEPQPIPVCACLGSTRDDLVEAMIANTLHYLGAVDRGLQHFPQSFDRRANHLT